MLTRCRAIADVARGGQILMSHKACLVSTLQCRLPEGPCSAKAPAVAAGLHRRVLQRGMEAMVHLASLRAAYLLWRCTELPKVVVVALQALGNLTQLLEDMEGPGRATNSSR